MNLYEKFVNKQNEIMQTINKQDDLNAELTIIKRDIFKKHKERFKKKPVGKTTISDEGFEIVYNRTEKVTLLTELIKQDEFESDCIVEKTVPKKVSKSFSKTEFKKLSDEKQEEMENYLARELNTPTISVSLKDEK